MTYVNHIYKGEGWTTNADVGKIFADFVWRIFLPIPSRVSPLSDSFRRSWL
jgi:hypothetical protein